MSPQWWPTNPKDIFPWLLHFVLVLNALARKSSDLLWVTKHTMQQCFHSSAKHLLYKHVKKIRSSVATSSVIGFVGHTFRVVGETWYFFCRFTVVHFDLISNIFLCGYASRPPRMKLLTWCKQSYKSGKAFRAGLGLKFFKIFRANIRPGYKTFYNIKSNGFFFRDEDLLCSPR